MAGGHSIQDTDVKYGLSVTGVIHPNQVFVNRNCRPGDLLLLTKPLGVGIVCTASRFQAASKEAMDLAVRSMSTLNKYASEIIRKYRTHACTDVTGFGFLVHLSEMLGDTCSAVIYGKDIPCIPRYEEYVEEFYITAAAQRNRNYMEGKVESAGVSFAIEELLFDPQTSGGLLVSMEAEDAFRAVREIQKLGLPGDCGRGCGAERKNDKSGIGRIRRLFVR